MQRPLFGSRVNFTTEDTNPRDRNCNFIRDLCELCGKHNAMRFRTYKNTDLVVSGGRFWFVDDFHRLVRTFHRARSNRAHA